MIWNPPVSFFHRGLPHSRCRFFFFMSCLSWLSAGRLSRDSGCQNWFFPALRDIKNRVVDVFKFKGFSTVRSEMRRSLPPPEARVLFLSIPGLKPQVESLRPFGASFRERLPDPDPRLITRRAGARPYRLSFLAPGPDYAFQEENRVLQDVTY
jgi:hypothetical protein